MDTYVWRLLKAVFTIAAAVALFVVGCIFSGGRFNNTFSVLLEYAMLFLSMIGVTQGLLVIIDYNREHKETEE